MSPCADDTVSVGQVLGTTDDVHFDEFGSVALSAGTTTVSVTFVYQKDSAAYRFEYLYVTSPETNPEDIRAVVQSQTTTGFVVALTGQPIADTDVLYWRVLVPDPLQPTQPGLSSPQYAIIPPSQSGSTVLPAGQDNVSVNFPVAQPDDSWTFLTLYIQSTDLENLQVFAFTEFNHSATGFALQLSGVPETVLDEINSPYVLHWKIA